ncbi:hypothetical protein H7097_04230 [Aeromicrobium sp.]|nr:hypothetical protein [Candidatus Saccharibacteria bacterium]
MSLSTLEANGEPDPNDFDALILASYSGPHDLDFIQARVEGSRPTDKRWAIAQHAMRIVFPEMVPGASFQALEAKIGAIIMIQDQQSGIQQIQQN